MAYWGEAMTHTHPVWMEQNADAARAILQRLGPTPEARLAKAKTEREKDYLRAIDVLYGDGDKKARDFAYADAMAGLQRNIRTTSRLRHSRRSRCSAPHTTDATLRSTCGPPRSSSRCFPRTRSTRASRTI